MPCVGNTSSLAGHLSREHKDETQKDVAKPQQPTLQSIMFRASAPLAKAKRAAIDSALTNYIIHSLAPIKTVEKPHFKAFVQELEPRYQVPCARTVSKHLKDRYEDEKANIMGKIRAVNNVSLTHDSWTSVATENFETVTCHLIDDSWAMKSFVLQTTKVEGSHNADNIGKFMVHVKEKWCLPEITVVTDNASVEVKAFSDLGWPRFACIGHTLNLVVRGALKEKTITRLISKGRNLVSYFHHSPQATTHLEEKQRLLGKGEESQVYKLMNDVPTRWNSTLDMLERLTLLMAPLHALCADPNVKVKDIRSNLFNFEEEQIVEDVIQILKPFKKATEMLSSESTPTLSYVFPTLLKLNSTLGEGSGEETSQVTALKESMKQDLKKRTQNDLPRYQMASALDPSTKAMVLGQCPDIKQRLIDEARNIQVAPLKPKEEHLSEGEAEEQPPLPSVSGLQVKTEKPEIPSFVASNFITSSKKLSSLNNSFALEVSLANKDNLTPVFSEIAFR